MKKLILVLLLVAGCEDNSVTEEDKQAVFSALGNADKFFKKRDFSSAKSEISKLRGRLWSPLYKLQLNDSMRRLSDRIVSAENQYKQKLHKAIQKEWAEKKKKNAGKIKLLSSSYDEFNAITFYSPKKEYNLTTYPYIGKSTQNVWLRWKIRYSSSSWLFVKSLSFKIDNDVIDYFPSKQFERDATGGYIEELLDVPVEGTEEQLLLRIMEAKIVKIRFKGATQYHDVQLSKKELQAFRDVIGAYYGLGGRI